jgi:hypothetical protein
MFAQKLLLPVFAVLSVAAGKSTSTSSSQTSTQASLCSEPSATIVNSADAAAYTQCSTVSGTIVISPDAAGVIDISGPSSVGGIYSHSAGNLITLSSSTIQSVGGTFDLFNLTTLSTLSFSELTSVETILWNALPNLGSLTFPQFISKATDVTIENTFLTTLDGINLASVNNLDINNNRRLSMFSTQIASVGTLLNVASNAQNLVVELPNLIWAANATFRNVSSVTIPSLAVVNGSLTFDENYFTSISAPNLTSVGNLGYSSGALAFVANAQLQNITLPALKTIGGAALISNNTALTSISLPALSQVGGAIDFVGNYSSVNLQGLTNVAGGFNLQSTATFSCDQFNSEKGNVIQGTYNCDPATSNPQTLASGTGTSGGASSTSTPKGAAVSYGVNGAVAGLSVVGGLLQMLL